MHIIDTPHGARLIKTLVQGGHYNRSSSTVDIAPSWPADDFVKALLSTDGIGKDDLVRMAAGNGAFIIAELVARVVGSSEEDGLAKEREYLRSVFDKKAVQEIETNKPKGLDVLSAQLTRI